MKKVSETLTMIADNKNRLSTKEDTICAIGGCVGLLNLKIDKIERCEPLNIKKNSLLTLTYYLLDSSTYVGTELCKYIGFDFANLEYVFELEKESNERRFGVPYEQLQSGWKFRSCECHIDLNDHYIEKIKY